MTLGNEKTEVFLFWMFARKTVLHPITGRTDRQTDRQTDRVRRNMRPPPREEGRIIKYYFTHVPREYKSST